MATRRDFEVELAQSLAGLEIIGSPAELTERIIERRERWGFSYVIVGANDVDKFAPVVAELAGT